MQPRPSPRRRAGLTAFSLAMLSACAGSQAALMAADPVVETRTVTRTFCPPELGLAVSPMPEPAPEAVLRGNAAGLRFHAELGAWGRGLADRLADAAAGCEPDSTEGAR